MTKEIESIKNEVRKLQAEMDKAQTHSCECENCKKWRKLVRQAEEILKD